MNEHLLSDRINKLPVSQTIAMTAKARELRESGVDVISLSLGEPDFNTPDFIKEAAKKAIDDNYNSYTPVEGYLDLRKAISKKFKRDNNLDYAPDQIVVSTGAKQSLANVAMVLLNPGDEAILAAPYWVSYEAIIDLCEAEPVIIHSEIDQHFKILPEQLEAAITPKTKLVFLNSPGNPSGAIYSKEELRALADVLVKYPQVYVIYDEIYEHLNYCGQHFSLASFTDMYQKTITVNGLSKAFAMTGWRVGYIGAPKWIAKACSKMQGQITSGTNCIAQRAAISALEAPIEKIQYMIDSLKERKILVANLLKEIPGFQVYEPKGAFYILPDISYYFGKSINGYHIKNANDFAMFLLEKANVATVTGEAFGTPNCIRLSYAASKGELIEALSRIKRAVTS